MFELYSERAKRVLAFAKYEASQMGSDVMRTEHLLLGLLREAEDVILELLQQWGIDPEEVRDEVEMMSTFNKRRSAPVEIVIDREVQRVLAYAVQELRDLADSSVGTEHILLGLLHEDGGMAHRVLAGRGLTLAKAREGVVAWRRVRAATQSKRRFEALVEPLARRMRIKALWPLLTTAQLARILEALGSLQRSLPGVLAFLADGRGLLVATSEDLPPELPGWLEELSVEPSLEHDDNAVLFLKASSGREIVFAFVKGTMFLIVVPPPDVDATSLRDSVKAVVRAVAADLS